MTCGPIQMRHYSVVVPGHVWTYIGAVHIRGGGSGCRGRLRRRQSCWRRWRQGRWSLAPPTGAAPRGTCRGPPPAPRTRPRPGPKLQVRKHQSTSLPRSLLHVSPCDLQLLPTRICRQPCPVQASAATAAGVSRTMRPCHSCRHRGCSSFRSRQLTLQLEGSPSSVRSGENSCHFSAALCLIAGRQSPITGIDEAAGVTGGGGRTSTSAAFESRASARTYMPHGSRISSQADPHGAFSPLSSAQP